VTVILFVEPSCAVSKDLTKSDSAELQELRAENVQLKRTVSSLQAAVSATDGTLLAPFTTLMLYTW